MSFDYDEARNRRGRHLAWVCPLPDCDEKDSKRYFPPSCPKHDHVMVARNDNQDKEQDEEIPRTDWQAGSRGGTSSVR